MAHGQATIGFTSVAGFPNVVAQGTQYNLSGWLINRGPQSFSGSMDIELLSDNGNSLTLDNAFSVPGVMQPGDSVYWSRNNYNFPPGHFRQGNNDVLIWPTLPSGGDFIGDSIGLQVYFTTGSAFRMIASGFEPFDDGVCLDCDYDLHLKAENVSSQTNTSDLCLYVQLSDGSTRCVMQNAGSFAMNEVAQFHLDDFNVMDEFGLAVEDLARIDWIEFYSKESGLMMEPLNRIVVPVESATVGHATPTTDPGIAVYPNPFTQTLKIVVPTSWRADAQVRLLDFAGRTAYAGSYAASAIELPMLAAGAYILEVRSSKGIMHQQVLKR
jgi:hypothetical protein